MQHPGTSPGLNLDHPTVRARSFGANSDDGASRAPGTSGSGAPPQQGRSSAGAGPGHDVLQSSKSAGGENRNKGGKKKNMLVKAREKLLRGVDKTLSGGAIAAKLSAGAGMSANDPNDPAMVGSSRDQHQPSNNPSRNASNLVPHQLSNNSSNDRQSRGLYQQMNNHQSNHHHQNRLAAPHFLVNAGKAGAAGMQSGEVTLQYYERRPDGDGGIVVVGNWYIVLLGDGSSPLTRRWPRVPIIKAL
eukprot:g13258.t1